MDKNIQEALKWIYASLGGDITDLAAVDDITAILNAIAKLDTVQKISGAKELPAVSSTDNGDVLTVVEGKWAKASPATELPAVSGDDNGDVLTVVEGVWAKAAPNSGGALFLTMDADTGTLDHTWQEIADAGFAFYWAPAEDSNKIFILRLANGDDVGGEYYLGFEWRWQAASTQHEFFTDTPNGYPVLD